MNIAALLTKETLLSLYREQFLTLEKIAELYGTTLDVVRKLLEEYHILSHSKTGTSSRQITPSLSEEDLRGLLKTLSASKIARLYGVSNGRVGEWMKYYGIQSTYFKNKISKEYLEVQLRSQTPLEITETLGVKLEVVMQRIRYYEIEIPIHPLLDLSQTVNKCHAITPDAWDNQGFIKRLQYGDPRLWASVMFHTEVHERSTEKFTERVYRLQQGFASEHVTTCHGCAVPLKFYTMRQGYGYSGHGVCRGCWIDDSVFPHNRSFIAEELFLKLRELLPCDRQDECRFSGHGGEHRVYISEEDRSLPFVVNTDCYYCDFWFNDRSIEFDGDYWHALPFRREKDALRDQYFAHRGIPVLRVAEKDFRAFPEDTVDRCLEFLLRSASEIAA